MDQHENTTGHLSTTISQREVYAQALRAGPTSALEHLRLLWNQRPPGILPLDCELIEVLTGLRERFVSLDMLQNRDGRGIVCDVDGLGADLWAACIQCNLLSLLLDMSAIDHMELQPRVRRLYFEMRRQMTISSALIRGRVSMLDQLFSYMGRQARAGVVFCQCYCASRAAQLAI